MTVTKQLSRRQFILGSSAAMALAAYASTRPFGVKGDSLCLVSACTDNRNRHHVAAVSLSGDIQHIVTLPARAHDVIPHPSKPGHVVVFARRPGYYAMEVDFIEGRVSHHIKPEVFRHFYGHGSFSLQGDRLFTSENDFASGTGKIVVRDSQTYQVLEEYDSGGIGPHQIATLPQSGHLVVANGGIKTHPDRPREKLNLDTMASNLSYLDTDTGKLLGQYQIPDTKLSIRHLNVSSNDTVVFGAQNQQSGQHPPLAYQHHHRHAKGNPTPLQAPDSGWHSMDNYTASVCVLQDSVAISSPRGNVVHQWQLQDGRYLGQMNLRDVAGLGQINGKLVASAGTGKVQEIPITAALQHQPSMQQPPIQENVVQQRHKGIRWDNHLNIISLPYA